MNKLRGKLTYANVVSTLCLFLLLGGGAAFAATDLAKNSVGTKQLKNNSVTTAKIKNGAVTGAKVKLSSLGTVPSATHASSADSATNAQTLGGLSSAQITTASKLKCPSGMILSAGLCFESTARASDNYLEAIEKCAKANLVLPSVTELWTFQGTLATAPPAEWAGQLFYDGTDLEAETLSHSSGGGGSTSAEKILSTNHPYRCAIPPSN